MLSHMYLAMNELGDVCGMTQQEMGRALARLGLWILNDRPTRKAEGEGYVKYRTYPHHPEIGNRSLPIWHVQKTLAALKTIGIEPLPEFTDPPPAPKFRPAPSYMDKHGDGYDDD